MIVTNNSTRTYSFEESFISPSTTKLIPDLFYADLNGLSGIVITGYPSSGETYATSELNSLAIRLKKTNEVAFVSDDGKSLVTDSDVRPFVLDKIRASIASAQNNNPQIKAPYAPAPVWAATTLYQFGMIVRGLTAGS